MGYSEVGIMEREFNKFEVYRSVIKFRKLGLRQNQFHNAVHIQ